MLLRRTTLTAFVIGSICLSASAIAQQPAVYEARLAPSAKNLGVCTNLDTPLAREHTVTIIGNKAAVHSNGGVKGDLESVGPNKFESTKFQMGSVQLVVTADMSVNPSMLSVTDKSYGCRWEGALKK